MPELHYYIVLRPDGTAGNIWRYDHEPDKAPNGSIQLASLSDAQWTAWMRNPAGFRWNSASHALEPVDVSVAVPQSVSIVQACIVMQRTPSPVNQGKTLYEDVDNFITNSSNVELKIAWQRATSFDRRGNFVNMVAQHLTYLTDTQLDQLFIAAANVTV